MAKTTIFSAILRLSYACERNEDSEKALQESAEILRDVYF